MDVTHSLCKAKDLHACDLIPGMEVHKNICKDVNENVDPRFERIGRFKVSGEIRG